MEYTKEEMKENIKAQIRNDNNKAIHALMTIYSYQTDMEQENGHTVVYNGVGFGGVDSEILSSYAEKYHRYGKLTPSQMTWVKKLMPKYAGQLLELSIAKGNFEKVKVLNPETNRMITKYKIKR